MERGKKIVILGAGFGGIQCALRLAKLVKTEGLTDVRITLIEKNRYHTFTPALYEVASASPKVSEDVLYHRVNILIRHIIEATRIEFIKAEVVSIDLADKSLAFSDGSGIDFDYLVLAAGAQPNFYNIKGIAEHALSLKDFISALQIRRAVKLGDEVPKTIVIGGAGPTGVELAGELQSCFKNECPQITLIEAAPRILPSFPERISTLAARRLAKLGITMKTAVPINEIDARSVSLKDGQKIPYDRFFWTGGITPGPLITSLPLQKEKGFLKVSPCLQVIDESGKVNENVFALGDCAISYDPKGNLVPWTAQKAIAEGQYIARTIVQTLKGSQAGVCELPPVRFIIPIGGKWAIAKLNGITYGGFFGWVLKNFVELRYLSSFLPWYKALGHWLATMVTFSRND